MDTPNLDGLKIFGSPSRYIQGPGATRILPDRLTKLGIEGPALVVASPSIRAKLDPVWTETFAAAGRTVVVRTFGGESSDEEIAANVAAVGECGAAVVVGVGGGKCLDTVRAVAGTLDLPVVNCPSVASSDAPCSALSAVYLPDGTFDHLLFYEKSAELVLVDTELVAEAPARLLVSGMGDALATWFEARTVIEARSPNQLHGSTTLAAGALARLCYDTLVTDGVAAVQAVEARSVTPALERIVEANTLLSGLGFESGGLAIAHSVHNGFTALGATHAYLHGEKVAFGLLVQLVVEGRPQSEIEEVMAFCVAVGLPVTLAGIGLADVGASDLQAVAEGTVAEGETAHHEPFPVTAGMILAGLRAADAAGRAFLAG